MYTFDAVLKGCSVRLSIKSIRLRASHHHHTHNHRHHNYTQLHTTHALALALAHTTRSDAEGLAAPIGRRSTSVAFRTLPGRRCHSRCRAPAHRPAVPVAPLAPRHQHPHTRRFVAASGEGFAEIRGTALSPGVHGPTGITDCVRVVCHHVTTCRTRACAMRSSGAAD